MTVRHCTRSFEARLGLVALLPFLWPSAAAAAQVTPTPAAQRAPLGALPAADVVPRVEFAFEARVTLAPAVVLGETPRGHRQYIPITGGTVAGPKFNGEVVPGGWDYQLRLGGGCGTLSADYFLRAQDGTVIHILNESFACGAPGAGGERSFFRPQFEAPKGPHDWLNGATFVALLALDPPEPTADGARPPMAIRIKFFQIR
jgi:hypothetical protein